VARRTLIFDVETQRLAHEVGGWGNVDRLGLAAAVTLDAQTGEVARFAEADAPALIEHLADAELIVGYNLLRFDYPVLRPYGLEPEELAGRTIDLLDHLYRSLGFHVSLDNVASATLGEHKSADGLAAVTWYRQGLLDRVFEYCEQDVRLTGRVWEHGRAQRQVRFRDRDFRLREVPVAW
jgi:DEAD/DEAH box helicase domain-containing protein